MIRPRLTLVAAFAVLLAACTGTGGADPTPGRTGLGALAGGTPLPEAELSVLGSDETVSTADWIGEPLVVNFWAEWCGPCREEMPDFEAVHQELGDEVRFIGIDYLDRAEAAIEFAEMVGVTYELVEDPDGAYFRAVQGRGTPQTLLVDAEGVIRYRHAGPLTREALLELLAEHLDVRA